MPFWAFTNLPAAARSRASPRLPSPHIDPNSRQLPIPTHSAEKSRPRFFHRPRSQTASVSRDRAASHHAGARAGVESTDIGTVLQARPTPAKPGRRAQLRCCSLRSAFGDANLVDLVSLLTLPRLPDFNPASPPFVRGAFRDRKAALESLQAVASDRIAAYHPIGFSGRSVVGRSTAVLVDDAYALVGSDASEVSEALQVNTVDPNATSESGAEASRQRIVERGRF